MPQSQECARIFPGSWLSQRLHLLENYLFPMPLLNPKVNYLFNFHLKFYLSVNCHFPQRSTALNEFTKLTACITTKKEQCSVAELPTLGSICLPARWENSPLQAQLCSGQGWERTLEMFKCLWIRPLWAPVSHPNASAKFMSGQVLPCTERAEETESRQKPEPMERHSEVFMGQAASVLRIDVSARIQQESEQKRLQEEQMSQAKVGTGAGFVLDSL